MSSLSDKLKSKWDISQAPDKDIKPPPHDKSIKNKYSNIKKNSNTKKDNDSLTEQSRKAILREPILKAQQLEYKIKQDQLKLEKESGNLIEYGLADYLFTGFMDKTNFQILTILKKIEPIIINLCRENEPYQLLMRIQKELESIVKDIRSQQKKEVENWRKDL